MRKQKRKIYSDAVAWHKAPKEFFSPDFLKKHSGYRQQIPRLDPSNGTVGQMSLVGGAVSVGEMAHSFRPVYHINIGQ